MMFLSISIIDSISILGVYYKPRLMACYDPIQVNSFLGFGQPVFSLYMVYIQS